MWPIMILPNGFGSHIYLYSPISFDSQDLNHNLSTRTSAPAGDASPVTTIVPRVVDKQWNGDADLKFPGSCRCSYCYYSTRATWVGNAMEMFLPRQFLAAGAATEDTCGDRVSADEQWKCVRPACHLVPAAGPAPGTMTLEWRVSAIGNGECSPGSQPTLRGTLAGPSIY